MDCLRYLGDQFTQIGGFDGNAPFWGVSTEPIIPGEELRLQATFRNAAAWAPSFVQSVSDYDGALGNRTFGLTLEDAEAQTRALRRLVDSANRTLPLHLIPRLFGEDKTGARAARRLESFAGQVARYQELAPVVAQALLMKKRPPPTAQWRSAKYDAWQSNSVSV